MTVRVTHVDRREDGEWKIGHRHGDSAPFDQSPPARRADLYEISTLRGAIFARP